MLKNNIEPDVKVKCIEGNTTQAKMASSKEYLDFILEQFSELNYVTYRAEDL